MEKIAEMVMKDLGSNNFTQNVSQRYKLPKYYLVIVYLILILIITIIISKSFITLILFSVPYQLLYTIKSFQTKEENQIKVWLIYWAFISLFFIVDPVLKFIFDLIIPLYDLFRLILIILLSRKNAQALGVKVLYDNYIRDFSILNTEKIKEKINDVIEKISNRNF